MHASFGMHGPYRVYCASGFYMMYGKVQAEYCIDADLCF